jgi:hypothetical protein
MNLAVLIFFLFAGIDSGWGIKGRATLHTAGQPLDFPFPVGVRHQVKG